MKFPDDATFNTYAGYRDTGSGSNRFLLPLVTFALWRKR